LGYPVYRSREAIVSALDRDTFQTLGYPSEHTREQWPKAEESSERQARNTFIEKLLDGKRAYSYRNFRMQTSATVNRRQQ